jgi:aspartoacylase
MASPSQVPAVLVVAGTHGNERNAPWLLQHWQRQPSALAGSGLALELVLGNPEAHRANLRYLERDLNRSFQPGLLVGDGDGDGTSACSEVRRARELLARFGPQGARPCLVVVDLHSTTSAMGNALVVYGRRPADLALAAALQARLGLPIYLHEADATQNGFLVERWPCGLVIEVGPVPQGLIQAPICRQTQLALEATLALLAEARRGVLRLPPRMVVHRHLGSLDLPRTAEGAPLACLHPQRQHRDWQPIQPGDPLFLEPSGATRVYQPPAWLDAELAEGPVVPVFINEAAYGEKGIALSLTERQVWPLQPGWRPSLEALAAQLGAAEERGAPL